LPAPNPGCNGCRNARSSFMLTIVVIAPGGRQCFEQLGR
jgi:hypothetical protein